MQPKTTWKSSRWTPLLAVASIGLLAGCQDATQPQVASGGRPIVLDEALFEQDIEPILQQRGCSNVACHGGQGAGELLLSGGLNVSGDFLAVSGLVTTWQPQDSPLLQKPLSESAGGAAHAGGDIFSDDQDADYQTLLSWIAGEVAP